MDEYNCSQRHRVKKKNKMPKKNKKKSKKSAPQKQAKRSVLKGLLFLTIGIFLTLVLVAAVFEKQIADVVISTLNRQLKTNLVVSDASLSLIWKFPQAAVYLHDAQIDGVADGEEKLLDVGSISLECSLWSLLQGKYNFTSCSINNGTLFIHKNERGAVNYDIFNAESSEDNPTNLNIAISNASINNISLHYLDQQRALDLSMQIQTADFAGDFIIDNSVNLNKHTMTSNAELFFNYLQHGEQLYLQQKEFAYDGSIGLDLAKERYTFEQLRLYAGENEFKVDGYIAKNAKGTEYNMVINSEQAMLGSLLQLVPRHYLSTIGQFESNGNINFEARINGLATDLMHPVVEINFGLKNGRITHPDLAGSLKNVSFDVRFNNGNGIDDQTAKLELIDFKSFINREPFNLTWEMIGLENPLINMSLDGKLPLNAVYAFLGQQVSDGSGWVEIEQIGLSGRMKDMISMARIPKVKLEGTLHFNRAYLMVNEIATTFETGTINLANNTFNLQDIQIKTTSSACTLNGTFQNVLPVLLSDSLNTQNAQLRFRSTLESPQLNLDELLAIGGGHSNQEIQEAVAADKEVLQQEVFAQRAFLTSFLEGSFDTDIASLTYGSISAQNFIGSVNFSKSIMSLKEVKVDAMQGAFELNSKIHFDKEPRLELFLDCQKINIQQCFSQLNNFNQSVLTDKNLKGELDALVKVNLFFDSLGNFKHQDLYVVADVRIKNGELNNFKMLENLASFVKMRDLEQISFTELQNQFKIENGRFYMPAMFVQSNALNLIIGGEYSFNHDMDFKIKVNAGQVFANKFKKYNPERKPVKAKRKGFFNIYRQIYGNLYGDYQILAKPALCKKYLEAQLRQNVAVLSNTLRAEFKNASTLSSAVKEMKQPEAWEDIPEYEEGEGVDEYLEGF